MALIHFTDDGFAPEVLQAKGVVLVDMFAPWCGPCKMMAPLVEELANEVKGVKIGKLDVDENPATASQFGIRSIPTTIIFKDGKEVKRLVGFQSKDSLAEAISEAGK